MTPEETLALMQAFGILRVSADISAVEIRIDDASGKLASLLETFGGVVGIDGYTRASRGCVTVSARRRSDAN